MCRFCILLGVDFRWDGGHGGAAFDAVWDERAPRREPSLEEFAAAAAAAAASTPAGAVLVEPLCRLAFPDCGQDTRLLVCEWGSLV